MAPAPSAARLSSLSTSTLSQILELTRATQLSLPSTSLSNSIAKNLSTIRKGLDALELDGDESDEVLDGLSGQYERLVGLAEPLGVHVEFASKSKGKTGRLVDTGEEDGQDYEEDAESEPLPDPLRPPHTAIDFPDRQAELERMEEDEEEMRRANSEVMQMQKRMLEDQDDTLDSLSTAIARQHSLSLNIASELELQSSLLDDTDSALDRTQTSLRRAGGRLDQFSRRAKETGSTGLIVLLVIGLVILILVFKM